MFLKRIFVTKKPALQDITLHHDIADFLGLDLINLTTINVYDITYWQANTYDLLINQVIADPITDQITDQVSLLHNQYLAFKLLDHQFNQTNDSSLQCIKLLTNDQVTIKHSWLYIWDVLLSDDNFLKLKNYIINQQSHVIKDLLMPTAVEDQSSSTTIGWTKAIVTGFRIFSPAAIVTMVKQFGLLINLASWYAIQNYFINQHRDPTVIELYFFDTYWSDHCRHTTFHTTLQNITIGDHPWTDDLQATLHSYHTLQASLKITNTSLMDLATIKAKHLQSSLPDIDISEENNAVSLHCQVVNDNSSIDQWIIQFKNETHNHPTEIEPYGGAATCLGGAIRDILAGRCLTYQALRISGAANPNLHQSLPGKLSQRYITKKAALGFANYGNQFGIATSFVKEFYHPGYVAKRFELGALVGKTLRSNVVRSPLVVHDLIILLNLTGKDGIGGARGSSIMQTDQTIITAQAEVQRGNAIEARQIQRLLTNPLVAKCLKKVNDVGAGGLAVALAELAPGMTINLNSVPLKEPITNPADILFSESQERMVFGIDSLHWDSLLIIAQQENVVMTVIGQVTEQPLISFYWNNDPIVQVSSAFLKTNGVLKMQSQVTIGSLQAIHRPFTKYDSLVTTFYNNLADINVACQKGLSAMFDATIGATTVILPYGGRMQLTPSQASVHLISLHAKLCTIVAVGFNPYLTELNPYLGGMYAVIESMIKAILAGGDWLKIRFSFQSFFASLADDPIKWSVPLLVLLGAFKIQHYWSLPAVGGKDSMSGSYGSYAVPPTFVSFALTFGNSDRSLPTHLQADSNYLYLFHHVPLANQLPDLIQLTEIFNQLTKLIDNKIIVAAFAIQYGGIAEALASMAFGNQLSFAISTQVDLFAWNYGSVIVETNQPLMAEAFIVALGRVLLSWPSAMINDQVVDLQVALTKWMAPLATIWPLIATSSVYAANVTCINNRYAKQMINLFQHDIVKVLILVFPGTNCEQDIRRRFDIYPQVNITEFVFQNRTTELINISIIKLAALIITTQMLIIPGGFSCFDEPDGAGKYIANVLMYPLINQAIKQLLAVNGLILGVCNGFQALVRAKLLTDLPVVLCKNTNAGHISTVAKVKVINHRSPWMSGYKLHQVMLINVSHGEGRLMMDQQTYDCLVANHQIAFQYVNDKGQVNNELNGSVAGIEGLISPCGLILGRMGHPERSVTNTAQNIPDFQAEALFFSNAISWFWKQK